MWFGQSKVRSGFLKLTVLRILVLSSPFRYSFPVVLVSCFTLKRQKQLRDIEISKILIQFYKYVIYEACNKELKPSVLRGSNRQLF